jgi:hypothetical protein
MRPQDGLIRNIKTAVLVALLFLPLAVTGQTPTDAPATADRPVPQLTLPQARALAIDALRREEPVLAYRLAEGLLQADAQSSFAYYTLAQAQKQMDQPTEARRSAAKAYRFADKSLHRFEAARLAAGLAYAEERPTLAQLWVRRAAQNAPNTETETQLGRDYARLRAENPLSFSLQGGIRPSNNVNNGSDMAVQIIDGLPYIGTLNGAAQALSGVVGHLDAQLGYRVRQSKRQQTSVTARLYVRRVALSDASKRLAPTVSNADYGSTFAEVGLRHRFALGQKGESGDLGLAFGQLWSASDKSYDFARLDGGRNWRRGKRTRLTLDGSFEMRASAHNAFFDSQILGAVAGVQHLLEGGDKLGLTLNLRNTTSDFFNARSTSATLRASYAFGKQVGPAKVSAGLTAGYADYPDFAALFAVPGGRQDRSVYADVDFFFPDIDYAGFAPNLRISAGRTSSNVSRYETRQLSVSLGIRSKF